MPERLSIGSIDLTAKTGTQAKPRPRPVDPETPFKILVMGNFKGKRPAEPAGAPSVSKPIKIDLDNQDTVLEQLEVQIEIPWDGPQAPPCVLKFKCLDDFHPDRVAARMPWFASVRELRRQLDHPKTFSAAAAQLGQWMELPAETTPGGSAGVETPSGQTPPESTDGLLERLLGRPRSQPAQPERKVDIQQLLREAVGSSMVPGADPRLGQLATAVDATMARRMNSVLHDPAFQSLEAAWRGVDFLIKRLELDESVQLYLADVDKQTLLRDAAISGGTVNSSAFYRSVVTPAVHTPGGQPWAVWLGQYAFTHAKEDVFLMATMGRMADAAGTPFLAAMEPDFIELLSQPEPPAPEVLQYWNALRQIPEASYLGLALPRFLLRLPYGKKSDPIEWFDYEEMPSPPELGSYVWGNPALACVCLLGQAFAQSGWDISGHLPRELDELPAHYYKEDGESKMTPCAEMWLNDQNSDDLLEQGLIPVQSVLRRNAIQVPRLQSIHHPLTELAGRWT